MITHKITILGCFLIIIILIPGTLGKDPDPLLQIPPNPIISDNYSYPPYTPAEEKDGLGAVANETLTPDRIIGGSQYHLMLLTGWNHISVPYRLRVDNNTAGEIFDSLTNISGHSLYRYEAGNWISVRPEERVSPLTSYWVFTAAPASIPLMVDSDQKGIFLRNLTTGWNGFGMIGEEPAEAREILSPLSDIWSYIIGFNTTTQMSDEPIIRGGSGRQNDTRSLLPYQGYWIYMTHNGLYEKNETPAEVPEVPPVWPEPLK
ncbi:MAG: hypothetical protein V1862_07190 [Methanobacteriota archaeon]